MVTRPRVRTVIRSGVWKLERTHKLADHMRRAAKRIFKCKTPAMGKHVQVCTNGHEHVRWNSCRHRSCPECSWPSRKKWLTKTERRLLAVPHHHVVFTIASEIDVLWWCNIPLMQQLLFLSARDTVMQLFAQRYGGACPGLIAVLHTWGRSLALHPHLHIILTRGGVDVYGVWQGPGRHLKCVLPARVVSEVFRGKLLEAVLRELEHGRLTLPEGISLGEMKARIAQARAKKWSVFIGNAGTRKETIIGYLGRYVTGGPIGNNRILSLDGDMMTFLYRDYRTLGGDGKPTERPMVLPKAEFLRRWFSHIPLPGSKVVRSYGIYSPAYRGHAPRPPARRRQAKREVNTPSSALEPCLCPICGASMKVALITIPDRMRSPPLGHIA